MELPGPELQQLSQTYRRGWKYVVAFAAHHLSWVPLTLVVLSLTGLALTPLILRERTIGLRADVRNVAEPARLELGNLRLGLARELTFSQRFALSPESALWFDYHDVVARDDSLLSQLESTVAEIGPVGDRAVRSLQERVTSWRQLTDMDGRPHAHDGLREAVTRAASYEGVLLATLRVDTALARAMLSRRSRLDDADRLDVQFAIAFVLIGCAASAAVLALTLRGANLQHALRRRAEEEALFRTLASKLSAASTVDEVANVTVAAALESSRIGGAYLTRTSDHQLVTIAARGTCASETGAYMPLPEWLGDPRHRDHPRIYTTELDLSRGYFAQHDCQRARSLLVVPLRYDEDAIGTLGIASAGGRRRFDKSSLRFGRMLGDLAAVALHRAEALEREHRARAEAEAAVRTRDAVVSIVSHDLRNPLAAIMSSAEFMLELLPDVEGRDVVRSQLNTLKHAADAMNRLVRDLLDVTRLESGPLPIVRRRVKMTEIADDVIGMFQAVLRRRRLTLRSAVAPDLPDLWADRDRLEQALSNLVSNAVKFTADGGTVTIAVDAVADGVRICVSDSGVGIPTEHLTHLFDRFWQASRDDRRGLGLGLSIVKGIVEAHGGHISVESTPGNGSSFCFVLPITTTSKVRGMDAVQLLEEVSADAANVPSSSGGAREMLH